MNARRIQHVTIIGAGLLGGSAALAIKARDPQVHVAGVGRRRKSLDEALRVGAIDSAHFDAGEVAGLSDLVILATPVRAFSPHLRSIAGKLKRGALVTDVGSTKAQVVRNAERILGKGGPFVGSHPMAGSERKGPSHADANLFDGATCIVTPTKNTPARLVGRAKRLWRSLGMRVLEMPPVSHDKAVANVSHLPHAIASLLMLLPDKAELSAAGPGFRDMTRLASGDPEVWRDIMLTNRTAILRAIDRMDDSLVHLRDLVEMSDETGIENFLAEAKKRRSDTVA